MKRGLVPPFRNNREERRFFSSGTDKAEQALADREDYDLATWWSVEVLYLLLITNTYAKDEFRTLVETRVARRRRATRHTVLHGLSTGYGSPSNSVRQFLILETLTCLRGIRYTDEVEDAA